MSRSVAQRNLPSLMNGTGELIENVDFKWCNLRHRLSRVKELILSYWLRAASSGCIQVDSLDQLHVVEERAERHEVRKTHFVSFRHLQKDALRINSSL